MPTSVFHDFLSCLRGSEQAFAEAYASADFLSCLRGSELEPSLANRLIVKELLAEQQFLPFF